MTSGYGMIPDDDDAEGHDKNDCLHCLGADHIRMASELMKKLSETAGKDARSEMYDEIKAHCQIAESAAMVFMTEREIPEVQTVIPIIPPPPPFDDPEGEDHV